MKIVRVASLMGFASVVGVGWSQVPLKVTDVRASSQQVGYLGPSNLNTNTGLTEDPPKSGNFSLSKDANCYTSGYGGPNDEAPLVHFDFGSIKTVDRFRVWNVNSPNYSFRGFRNVTIQFSDNATRWTTVPERMEFAKAPGTDKYYGEMKTFARPITARYIRFCVNSTWRNFPQSDVASLGRVKFYEGGKPTPQPADTGDFPAAAGIIDVTAAPYFAKPDGRTDCTAALQKAILDWEGRDRIVYLPKGVYLVSKTLRFSSNSSSNRNNYYGRHHLLGAGSAKTEIRLKDSTFTNPKNVSPVIAYGTISFWNGRNEQLTADWFNNSFAGITINTGKGNVAAKGIEFYSNNTGSLRDVIIRSGDLAGEVGLDLGHADLNGPLLVKNLVVLGYKIGVSTAGTVNSQVFENISLRDQSSVAFQNNGQCVSVRNLTTIGSVTGFRNLYGFVTLTDSFFSGKGAASALPAVENGEFLNARDVKSSGFKSLIANSYGDSPSVAAASVTDYVSSGAPSSLFPTNNKFLRLPVEETPTPDSAPIAAWANPRDFRITSEYDDSAGLQRAIDSGAEVVYLPADASFVFRKDVYLRGKVRLLLGFHAMVQSGDGARFRLADGATPMIRVERMKGINFTSASARTLAIVDTEGGVTATGTGKIFLENVGGAFSFDRNKVWARQMNAEAEGLKISNSAGSLWILGLKTERAGTLIKTEKGGSTEVLGGLCYTTTPGKEPMFIVADSDLGASIGEVSYGPPPFGILVRQSMGTVSKDLLRGQAPLRFSFMNGSALTLFRANKK